LSRLVQRGGAPGLSLRFGGGGALGSYRSFPLGACLLGPFPVGALAFGSFPLRAFALGPFALSPLTISLFALCFCGAFGLCSLFPFGAFAFGLGGAFSLGAFPFGLFALSLFALCFCGAFGLCSLLPLSAFAFGLGGSFSLGAFPFGLFALSLLALSFFGLRNAVLFRGAAILLPRGAIPLPGVVRLCDVLWLCRVVLLGVDLVGRRARNSSRSGKAWQERICVNIRILIGQAPQMGGGQPSPRQPVRRFRPSGHPWHPLGQGH